MSEPNEFEVVTENRLTKLEDSMTDFKEMLEKHMQDSGIELQSIRSKFYNRQQELINTLAGQIESVEKAVNERISMWVQKLPTVAESYNAHSEHPDFVKHEEHLDIHDRRIDGLEDHVNKSLEIIHEKQAEFNRHYQQTVSYVSDLMLKFKQYETLYYTDMLFLAGVLIGAGFETAGEILKEFQEQRKPGGE